MEERRRLDVPSSDLRFWKAGVRKDVVLHGHYGIRVRIRIRSINNIHDDRGNSNRV